eukprot:scaffold160839_cov36-Tisochrysis_lutea.AAC.2
MDWPLVRGEPDCARRPVLTIRDTSPRAQPATCRPHPACPTCAGCALLQGLVMLSERGTDAVRATRSSSFVCDLRKWLEVMETYENGE